jgi:hypothetical protein
LKKLPIYLLLIGLISIGFSAMAQSLNSDELKKIVQTLKSDARGPYQDIKWFCKDGSIVNPQERCPQPGGVQHARLKTAVNQLASTNGLFFNQILTGTDFSEFWNESQMNSRMKQYQLQKYLRLVDNGWIYRKAQYYRGALQVEDEEAC